MLHLPPAQLLLRGSLRQVKALNLDGLLATGVYYSFNDVSQCVRINEHETGNWQIEMRAQVSAHLCL